MWVNLIFSDGDPYNNHCNGTNRKGQILFICDPTVKGNVSLIYIFTALYFWLNTSLSRHCIVLIMYNVIVVCFYHVFHISVIATAFSSK